MDIPKRLSENIENISKKIAVKEIVKNSQNVSKKYRNNDNTGKKFVSSKEEAISYAISRMPATYGAVYSVLNNLEKLIDIDIKNIFDVGAGTGAATWACNELITNVQNITCYEREEEMRKIGISLMQKDDELSKVEWKYLDVLKENIDGKADLVITSYMINELPKIERKNVIEKLWNACNKLLIIIEPGTPEGFKNILHARETLLENGGIIIAPCAHSNKCQLNEEDWCSFYTRISRNTVQRQAKRGELGYEDEKFSYIVFAKNEINVKIDEVERILRHPKINSGHVNVKLCTKSGIVEKIFSKKDGEKYKSVKKMDAGEFIN